MRSMFFRFEFWKLQWTIVVACKHGGLYKLLRHDLYVKVLFCFGFRELLRFVCHLPPFTHPTIFYFDRAQKHQRSKQTNKTTEQNTDKKRKEN